MKITINLNETVSAELTEHGKKIAKDYIRGVYLGTSFPNVEEIASDMANKTRWQLHELMHVFGEYTANGRISPIVNNEIHMEIGK